MSTSTCVGFVLFDLRQHPIEFTRGYLAAAEFTNAARVDFQRSAAVWTIQISSGWQRLRLPVADKRPVLAPAPQAILRTANDAAVRIYGVIISLGSDAQRYCVIERVFLELHRLH